MALAVLVAASAVALGAPGSAGAGPRIVGGSQTTIAEWPWQVSVAVSPAFAAGNAFDRHLCGGSLITPVLAVTAAHCVYDDQPPVTGFFSPNIFSVISGRTRLSNPSTGQEVSLATYHIPRGPGNQPLYNPNVSDAWDVVVLQLAAPSPQQTIKLAGPAETALWAPGNDAYITGWGATSEGGPSSDFLLAAQIDMLADATCQATYGVNYDPATMVCAGHLPGGIDTCQGDSGGPLVVPTPSGQFRLVGDTSFGIGCARPNVPGVYGRVGADPIRGWIAGLAQSVSGINVIGAPPPPPPPPPPPRSVRCDGVRATRVGTRGPDGISGTAGRDVVVSFGGNDRINVGRGNDLVCAGSGADAVFSGPGADRVFGGTGADRLLGDAGADLLAGGRGNDRCFGGAGRDRERSCERP